MFASPIFWQIRYLVTNLTKKNLKSSISELNQVCVCTASDACILPTFGGTAFLCGAFLLSTAAFFGVAGLLLPSVARGIFTVKYPPGRSVCNFRTIFFWLSKGLAGGAHDRLIHTYPWCSVLKRVPTTYQYRLCTLLSSLVPGDKPILLVYVPFCPPAGWMRKHLFAHHAFPPEPCVCVRDEEVQQRWHVARLYSCGSWAQLPTVPLRLRGT